MPMGRGVCLRFVIKEGGKEGRRKTHKSVCFESKIACACMHVLNSMHALSSHSRILPSSLSQVCDVAEPVDMRAHGRALDELSKVNHVSWN